MALHLIFKFDDTSEELPEVYFVRYDDADGQVKVFRGGTRVTAAPNQSFPDVGDVYNVAGIDFVKQNLFPFAKKDTAPPVFKPLTLSLVTKYDVTQYGLSDGFISVSGSGGYPFPDNAYDFNINAGPYTRGKTNFENLSAGTYVIGVKDSTGQNVGRLVTILQPEAPVPEQPTYGCKDPNASNYDAEADINDPSLCEYPAAVLTEVKRIEVRPCPADGVMLRWICNLGNPDCWMFSGKIDNLITSVTSGEYEQAFGFKATIRKHLQPSVLLNTSGPDYNRFMAVSQVFSSQHVVMEDAEGNQTRVFVEPSGELGMREPTRRLYTMQVKVSLYPINAPN